MYNKEAKPLQGMIDILSYFYKNKFTYAEIDEVIELLQSQIPYYKFDTVEEYLKDEPSCNIYKDTLPPIEWFDVEEWAKETAREVATEIGEQYAKEILNAGKTKSSKSKLIPRDVGVTRPGIFGGKERS